MAKINYTRIRKSFYTDKNQSPEIKRNSISVEINNFLDSYGESNWELVHYNELVIDEGTVHVTAVFKNLI